MTARPTRIDNHRPLRVATDTATQRSGVRPERVNPIDAARVSSVESLGTIGGP